MYELNLMIKKNDINWFWYIFLIIENIIWKNKCNLYIMGKKFWIEIFKICYEILEGIKVNYFLVVVWIIFKVSLIILLFLKIKWYR